MRGAFENALKIMIVVLILPMQLLRFPAAKQLSVYVAVLRTIVRFQCQTAIGPQLPLTAEAMWCLDEGD